MKQLACVLLLWSAVSVFAEGTGLKPSSSSNTLPAEEVKSKILKKSINPIIPKMSEIIKLETTDSCLISNVGKIKTDGDLLFIKCGQALGLPDVLFVFNRNGKFIRRISSKGQGPQEYIVLSSYYLDKQKKTVNIVDDYRKCILTFSYDGKYIGVRKIPSMVNSNSSRVLASIAEVECVGNKLFFDYYIGPNGNVAIRAIDLNTGKTKDLFSYGNIRAEGFEDRLIKESMTTEGGMLSFIKAFNDTIFSVQGNNIQPRYILNLGKNVTADMLKEPFAYRDVKDFGKGYFDGFDYMYETDKHILLTSRRYGNPWIFYIVDKSTGQFSSMTYTDVPKCSQPWNIKGVIDNQFVRSLDYVSLEAQLKDYEECNMLVDAFNSLEFDANPILVLYDIE